MKNRKWLAALLLVTALTILLTGCGSSHSGAAGAYTDGGYYYGADGLDTPDAAYPEEAPAPSENSGSSKGMGGLLDTVGKAQGLKLIYTGRISLETRQFDGDLEAMTKLVEETGGYIASSNLSSHGDDLRYLALTVRVPKDKFSYFMETAGGIGNNKESSVNSQDVTSAYTDTELRIKTLRTQHERLLALLKDAATLEDVIELEMRIAEVESQIEEYERVLRDLDSRIDYSTVNVEMIEVKTLTAIEDPKDSLGDRIRTSWFNSLSGLKEFGQDLLVFLVGALPVFVVLLLPIGLIILIVVLCTRSGKKKRQAAAQRPMQPPENP